jgi:hypothetical protein
LLHQISGVDSAAGVGTIVGVAGTQEGMRRKSRRERNIRLDIHALALDKNIPFLSKRKKGNIQW